MQKSRMKITLGRLLDQWPKSESPEVALDWIGLWARSSKQVTG